MAEPNYGLLDTTLPYKVGGSVLKGMGDVNALRAQQLQNEASQFEMQNALAEQEAYKQAARSGGVQQALMERGLGKQAAAYGKTTAEAQKLGLEAQYKKIELHRARMGQLAADPSDQNIIGSLKQQVQNGEVSPDEAMQAWSQVQMMNPQQRTEYFTKMGVSLDTLYKTQAEQQQRMQGTVPAGYRMNAGGTLEAIPGGPTTTDIAPKDIQKRNEKFPAAQAAYKTFEKDSSNLIDNLKALKNHKGLSGILGTVYGRTPSITADSQAAQQLYDQILSQGQFNTLSALRQASPTGGALGNVSDRENQALRQAFGALGRVQSESDFKAAIDRVIKNIEGSQGIIKEAFDETYSYKNAAPAAGGAPVTGNSPAAQALARFRASKGQ